MILRPFIYSSFLLIQINYQGKLEIPSSKLASIPKFKTALEYRDRFTFGHEKIDSF